MIKSVGDEKSLNRVYARRSVRDHSFVRNRFGGFVRVGKPGKLISS